MKVASSRLVNIISRILECNPNITYRCYPVIGYDIYDLLLFRGVEFLFWDRIDGIAFESELRPLLKGREYGRSYMR